MTFYSNLTEWNSKKREKREKREIPRNKVKSAHLPNLENLNRIFHIWSDLQRNLSYSIAYSY